MSFPFFLRHKDGSEENIPYIHENKVSELSSHSCIVPRWRDGSVVRLSPGRSSFKSPFSHEALRVYFGPVNVTQGQKEGMIHAQCRELLGGRTVQICKIDQSLNL